MPKVQVELAGVPETALWTLYYRALEARRPDTVLADPLAVELVDRLDHPFAERFGERGFFAQWQALRTATFDRQVRRFAAACPGGTVVALGEGLDTGFWRAGPADVDWLGVELPEMAALQERLLPASPRRRSWTGSALDPGWMDAVDPARGVLLLAQGLLPFLAGEEAHRLIAACATRFPGATLIFDAVPAGMTGKRAPERAAYRPPAWRWGVNAAEERRLAELPGVAELRVLRLPRGRGLAFGVALPLAARVPALRRAMLSVFAARFTP